METTINLAVFRFAVSLLQKAFADVREDEMRLTPLPTMNPPIWILGHLVNVVSLAPVLLGGERTCPIEYGSWFGPGSKPEALPSELPTKRELLTVLSQTTEQAIVWVGRTKPDDWKKPNPTPFFQTELPTLGDIVENLLGPHTMLHVGQMTVWRQARALPRIITLPKQMNSSE
jgi:DinB superfamily